MFSSLDKKGGVKLDESTEKLIEIPVRQLTNGMVIGKDVLDKAGRLLIKENKKVTQFMIKKIKRFRVPSVYVYLSSYEDNIHQGPFEEQYNRLKVILKSKASDDLKRKTEFDVYDSFYTQIENLIIRCSREILRADIDFTAIQKVIMNVISDKDILDLIMNLRVKAHYLLSHCVEVTILSTLVGCDIGLNEDEIKNLILAAFLHDIGMTQIPEKVLFKTSPLTEEEKDLLRSHSAKSVVLLSQHYKINNEILEIIFQHHERYNGTGYPSGLTADVINKSAKILSVCDVYSALSHDRSYRIKVSPQEKIEFFRGSGGHYFNYDIIRSLLDKVSIYYEGQWVMLNNGQVGVITSIDSKYPTRPYVKVVYDKYGSMYEQGYEIFLGERKYFNLVIKRVI